MSNISVDSINLRLKEAGIRLRIRLKGNALYIRGTFPPKPGDGVASKRYDHPTGFPASKYGLRQAERQIHIMAQALTEGSFDWRRYTEIRQDSQAKPIAQLIEEFKANYLQKQALLSKLCSINR